MRNAGIYVDSLLLGEYELCSCNEIETAVKTLACFVKGVAAASVVGLSDVEVISKIQPQHEQDQIRSVQQELRRGRSVNYLLSNETSEHGKHR